MDTVRMTKDNSVHIEDKRSYMNLNSEQGPTTSTTARQALWTNKGKLALAIFVGQAFVLLLVLVAKTSDVQTFTEKIFKFISTRNDSIQQKSYNIEQTDVIKNIANILDEQTATLDQRQSILIANLTADISRLQQQVASILSDVEDMSSTDSKIKLCASHIRTGKVVEALELLDSLNNSTLLNPIITLAYNSNPVNVEKIVQFTKTLPRCSQDEIAYKTLFQEMQKNNMSIMPEILFLFDATSSCATTLSTLRTEIKPFVNDVISSWVDEIRSGNFGEIIEFIKYPAANSSMSNHLPNLIKSVYQGSLANFDRVLEFIIGLPNFPLTSLGYISLLTEMKISGDLFSYEAVRLLYTIKEKLNEREDSTDLDASTQIRIMNNLKNILPGNILGLVWSGEKCTVQNVQYSEYLYSSDYMVNGSRKVFTWVAGNKINSGDWAFHSKNGGVSFLMRNLYQKLYLIASDQNKDLERRFVYTRRGVEDEKGALWKIKPSDNSKFTLVSEMYNEYLFAEGDLTHGHENKRRGVFTRNRTDNVIPSQSQWLITC